MITAHELARRLGDQKCHLRHAAIVCAKFIDLCADGRCRLFQVAGREAKSKVFISHGRPSVRINKDVWMAPPPIHMQSDCQYPLRPPVLSSERVLQAVVVVRFFKLAMFTAAEVVLHGFLHEHSSGGAGNGPGGTTMLQT